MKAWHIILLVISLAQMLCAGCVGGKLLDPSAARLLDDNRQPRPYPSAAAARSRKPSVTTADRPQAVGTGVETAAGAPAQATPKPGSNDDSAEVTLANRSQHVGDQTNVLQIPPSRIGAPVISSGPPESEPIPPAEAPAKVSDPPPSPQLLEPVKSPLASPPPSSAPAKSETPELPASPVPNPVSIPMPGQAFSPTVEKLAERPPDVPLISDAAEPSRLEITVPEPAQTEPLPVSKTADELLPEDPAERTEWLQTRLIQALEQAARKAREAGVKDEASRLDQQLRLAYLIADDINEASRGVENLPEVEREAYKQLMFGLSQFLSEDDSRRPAHRNARVVKALRDAIRELTPASRLELKNLAFCERVEQFGWFTEFRRAEFAPKQQVILYVEVENATAEEKSQHSFETELAGSYQIFDDTGKLAHERTLPLDKETCRNYRRDYFLAYRIYFPEDIAPGHYRLELTIEDLKAKRSGNRKLGEAMIEFRVRS